MFLQPLSLEISKLRVTVYLPSSSIFATMAPHLTLAELDFLQVKQKAGKTPLCLLRWEALLRREGNWAEEHGAERGGESVQGRREGKPRAVDEGRRRARIGENLIKLHILNETDSCVTVASQLRHSCVTVASQLRHSFCSIFPFS